MCLDGQVHVEFVNQTDPRLKHSAHKREGGLESETEGERISRYRCSSNAKYSEDFERKHMAKKCHLPFRTALLFEARLSEIYERFFRSQSRARSARRFEERAKALCV